MNASDLIEMRKVVAAATLIQSGAFKEELDKIAEMSAALDAKMTVVKTLEQVEARRAEIVKELEGREAACALMERSGNIRLAEQDERDSGLVQMAKDLEAKQADLASRETSIQQAETKIRADAEASAARSAKRVAELDERQQRLVDRENKLAAGEKALQDRIAAAAKLMGF